MIDLLTFAAYVAGFVFTYRRMYVALDSTMHGDVDGEDKAMNATFAIIAAVFWPVVIVGYGVWRVLTPVTPRQREQELREREAHIAKLEKELGIGQEAA